MTKQIRRCHVCGTINELDPNAENMVHVCDGCGKHLAPFYFFEESEQSGVGDNTLVMSLRKEAIGYQPLWGFSAFWPEEELQPEAQHFRSAAVDVRKGNNSGQQHSKQSNRPEHPKDNRIEGRSGRHSKGSRKD